jgi:hypothetical protein
MFYPYSGAQVNPQLRGGDRRVITPRTGTSHGVDGRL